MHPRSPICRPCDFCLTQNLKLITGNSLTPARLAFENRQFLPSRAQSHSRAPVTPLSPFFLRPEQRATVVPQLPFSDLSSTRPSRLSADQAITYRMEPQGEPLARPAAIHKRNSACGPGPSVRQSLPGSIRLCRHSQQRPFNHWPPISNPAISPLLSRTTPPSSRICNPPLFLATLTSTIIPAARLVLPLLRILLNSLSPNSARICNPAISPRPNQSTPLLNRNSPSLAPRSPLPRPPRATP
jgi:hypothetical protein